MAVHTGMQRENIFRGDVEGWKALTSLNLPDFDLPVGTKIQYAFSYVVVENGKSRTVVKKGSITLRTGRNRDWHQEFGIELNKIIESDADLRGIFDVDTLEHTRWRDSYWGGDFLIITICI
ncbi:hypothetical protein [Candidatus Pantoea multigeneris]|uniref:C2 domain-containing protein n=1 Tax=Candidatus Pantoea multigeneris TaxID=2608357 RepID=A0ABX0R8L5_9GAMM|nr:hypothetical protein [Pantoea multigeneris]NIF20004.1 hypothetical protein [Pantoea multigeneris]